MGFPTKVQLINREKSQQWYINFPSAIAQAMEFQRGETVEWIIEDKAQLVLRRLSPPPSALKKKTPGTLMDAFNELWEQTRPAFAQERTWERAKRLALSLLVCLGRHTITGLITTAGGQFEDWSADFRLFEEERFDPASLFRVVRQAVQQHLDAQSPFVVLMDDTLLRKRGRKVEGASWRRDPLGPPFRCNFVWAQRFLEISAVLPEHESPSRARAIPIDLFHSPSLPKPPKNASQDEWQAYRQEKAIHNLSWHAVERLRTLRHELDHDPGGQPRSLIVAVDGSFTNETVLQHLPKRTTLIGRIRKDTKLYALPDPESNPQGRKRTYGDRLPTPEQIRQDETIPWQCVSAFAAGKIHNVTIKTLAPVRWRTAGENHDLRLVVIRPVAYRLSQKSRLLYRQPSYLICTDPALPLDQLVQFFVWRWEIESGFRDEKTLVGMEQPQVRILPAVESIPPFFAVAYAFLLLAAHRTEGLQQTLQSIIPKWRKEDPDKRPSTADLISLLRHQLWGLAIRTGSFSGFVDPQPSHTKPEKLEPSLDSACFYAHG